jgi:hypothetical protein
MRIRLFIAALGFASTAIVWLSSPPLSGQGPPAVAFVNVTVIPMDRDRTLAGQTVVVRDGKIASVGAAASANVPSDALRVEATGRYLLPALGEMHAHLGPQEDMNLRILELNVLHGITTIRGMLGHPSHLPLRERVAKGDLVGPTIYTSGPSFNGQSATSPEVVTRMVTEQKAAGYDFLKIHPGVPLAAFNALVETAGKVGITFQGHVPDEVGLARALAARYRAIDHLDGYVQALAGWAPGPDAPPAGFFGSRLATRADTAKIPALVAETRKAGVWIVPTEAVAHSFLSDEDPTETLKRPEMRLVPMATREGWLKQKTGFNTNQGIGSAEERQRYFTLRRQLIKALHQGGVKLLLGADSPQVMNVPGVATHRELKLVVEAGLTPYQALESGTRNVAEFFGTSAERGIVAPGKRADLILVEANPLQDVTNASKIAGVMVRGRWLAKDEIEKRLRGLEVPPSP